MLKIDKTNCFCPPPNNQNVKIIELPVQHHTIKKHDNENKIIELKKNQNEYLYFVLKKKKKALPPSLHNKEILKKEESINGVTVKKLFDYSCAEESHKINISTILNQIGKTLEKPVTQMVLQSNIYYHYDILHLGCPSAEDQENIKKITDIIDNILSVSIQMLPGGKQITVLQNIIAPLLIAASKDLDGNGINVDLFSQVNQNSLFFFQDITRSLTINDYYKVENPVVNIENQAASGQQEINNNESIILDKNERLGIQIDDVFYDLHHDASGKPYILENGEVSLVGYHKSFKKWLKLYAGEETIYSSYNIENINSYGISLAEMGQIEVDETINSEYVRGLVTGSEFSQYIFTCGKLIEIQSAIVDGEEVITTASTALQKKIILKNRFDWFFEDESAKISESLKSFVSEELDGEEITDDNLFTMIKYNGVSYNSEGKAYLKIQNKYYRMYPEAADYNTYFMYTKYDEEINIINRAPWFTFKWSTVIPIGIDTEVCGIVNSLSTNEYKISIDGDAYDFLLLHGKTEDFNKNNLREVFKGIYQDTHKNNHILVIKNIGFTVSKYIAADNYIFIKSLSDVYKNIKLYVLDNLIIRVRAREIDENYIKIKNCEFKRDLTDEICLPIFISERLKIKLDNVVKKSSRIHISDDGIVHDDHIPGCFKKNNQLYFYHDGFLFKAAYSDVSIHNEDPRQRIVDLFIDTFTKSKKHIASFIVERKDNRIELKEPSIFVAEKTGITPESYEHFLKNNKYYNIPNFMKLENVINEVNEHGSLKIIDPISKKFNPISEEFINYMCRTNFFPTIDNPDFTILNINHITDNAPFYFRASKVQVLSSLRHASHILSIAMKELSRLTENAEFYIKSILRTERPHIAKEFASQLHKKLKIIRRNLNRENINLVSIDRVAMLGKNTGSYVFYAALSTELRNKGTFAFALTDDSKRIYISIDKLYFVDPDHPDHSLRKLPAMNMVDTLIHETSHIDRLTTDIFYLKRDQQGNIYPILDEVDRFLEHIEESQSKSLHEILKMNNEYINNVNIYKNWKDKILNDKKTLAYFSSHDTGILANYYLHNADFITKIVTDLYKNSFVDQQQNSFLEKITHKLHFG